MSRQQVDVRISKIPRLSSEGRPTENPTNSASKPPMNPKPLPTI